MLRASAAWRRPAAAGDAFSAATTILRNPIAAAAAAATARFISRPPHARALWSMPPLLLRSAAAASPVRCACLLSGASAMRCDSPRRFLSSAASYTEPAAASLASAANSAPAPAASSLHAQLRTCMSRGQSDRASSLLSEFEQRGGRCDATLLAMQIGCHAAAGDWQGAERVWARFAQLALQPDSLSYRNLMRVYTNAGGAQLAKIDPLLAEMQSSGIAFSATDYAHLRKTAHLCKLSAEVRRWDKLARAARSADTSSSSSSSPSASSVTTSAAAAAATKPARPAASPVVPPLDAAALRSQLSLCVATGDSVRAGQALRDFELAGGQADLTMLTLWIITHIPSGDWRGADRAWARMSELGLRPDAVSYCSLIQVLLRSGHEQRARIDAFLAEMARADLGFTNSGYEHLLRSAHTLKLPLEVRRWSEHARKARRLHQLDPSVRAIAAEVASAAPAVEVESFPVALNGDTKSPLSPPRPRVLMAGRQSREYSAALARKVSELAATGDSKAAERLVADSERSGVVLDVGVLNAWLGCYRKSGDCVGAEHVWRRMRQLKVQPTNVSFCTLILVYLQNGTKVHLAKIDPLLSRMHRAGLHFTSHDYQQVIETFHACKLTNRMQQWSTHSSAAALFGRLNDTPPTGRPAKEQKKDKAATAEAVEQKTAHDAAAPASAKSSESAAPTASTPTLLDSELVTLRARLKSLARAGDTPRAAAAVRKFEQVGGALDMELLNAWMGCHQARGDWKGAERVWARMTALELVPNSASYATLIQIYMRAGGEQLAKIDPLLATMQTTSELAFSDQEHSQLLKCALRCTLPNEAHRWTLKAPAASTFMPRPHSSRPTPAASRARSSRSRSITASSSSAAPTTLVSSRGLSRAPPHRAYHRSASVPRPAAPAASPRVSISSPSSREHDPADAAAAVARAELDRVVVSETARDAEAQSAARRRQAARDRDRKDAAEERKLYRQFKSGAPPRQSNAPRSDIGPVAVPFSSATLAILSPEPYVIAPSSSSSIRPFPEMNPLDVKSSIHLSTFRRLLQRDKSCGSAASDTAFDLALKTSGHEETVDRVVMEAAMESVLLRLQRDHSRGASSDPALLDRAASIWREAKTRKLLSANLVHTLLQCYSARGNGYNAPAQLDLLSEAVSLEPDLQSTLRVGAVKPVLVLAKSYTLALRSMVVAFQQEGVLAQPAQFAEAQKIGREIFAQLLHRISSQRMFSDLSSSWSEWRSLLTVLRTLKLYDVVRQDAWKALRALQEKELSSWRDDRHQKGLEAQTVPPPMMRVPLKILALVVHCAVEEHGNFTGVRAARLLIEELQRPETIDRFETPEMLRFTLLEAYAECPNPDLAELRAMYDSIATKDAQAHAIMLRAYCGQRQLMHASQLCAEIEAQPLVDAATAVALFSALAEIASQSDQAASAVQRAEALWARAKADSKLLSAEVVRGLLSVLHQRRNAKRCVEVLVEALQLEHAAAPPSRGAGPPVFVDAQAYSLLFNTCAQSSEPKLFEDEALRAFEELQARHAQAVKQGRKARAAALEMAPSVRDSYTRFRQRCNPASYPSLELLRATPSRERTTHSYVQPMHELAESGDVSAAESLIAEFEAPGRRWSVDLLAAWIGVYRASGDTEAAERVWQRIPALGLAPNAAALGALMQVYMHAGTADSLGKLEALSTHPSSPRLRARDLDHLIFTGLRCNLPRQIAALADRARELQLWDQLNPKARSIVAKNERKQQQQQQPQRPAVTGVIALDALAQPNSSSSSSPAWTPAAVPSDADAPTTTPDSQRLSPALSPSAAAIPALDVAVQAATAAAAAPAAAPRPLSPSSVPSASASRLLRAGSALQEAMVVASSLSTKANPAELTGRIWLKLHLRALDAVEAFIIRVTGGR